MDQFDERHAQPLNAQQDGRRRRRSMIEWSGALPLSCSVTANVRVTISLAMALCKLQTPLREQVMLLDNAKLW